MSFTDAVSRVSQIQAQIASIQTAFDPSVARHRRHPGHRGRGQRASGSFADALAQAQSTLPAGGQDISSTGPPGRARFRPAPRAS